MVRLTCPGIFEAFIPGRRLGWEGRRLQAPEMLTPALDRLLADFVFLGCLGHRDLVGLARDRNHPLVRKTALPHRLLALTKPFVQRSMGRNSRAGLCAEIPG